MSWIHRIIEHRLQPDRRLGLEKRVADRRLDKTLSAEQRQDRRKGERRAPRERRGGQSRRRATS
jgi:hypothetical protein